MCSHKQTMGTSNDVFCPGYVEALPTPYEGLKMEKLTAMANVMCSHCQTTDLVCFQLFCAPDQLMVDITMAILEKFCISMETLFPECHTEYCESVVKRRAAEFQTTKTTNIIGGCYPTLEWSGVHGMDQWCLTNCKSGTNDNSCPASHCVCQTGTTGTATDSTGATGAGLGDTCLSWEASSIYRAVAGMDAWCESVCSQGGSCPSTHCACAETLQTTTTAAPTTTSTTAAPTTTFTSKTTTVTPATTTTASTTSSTTAATSSSSTTSTTTAATTTAATTTATFTESTIVSSPSTTESSTESSTTSSSSTITSTTSTQAQTSTRPLSTTSQTLTTLPPSTTVTIATTTEQLQANVTEGSSEGVVHAVMCDHARSLSQNILTQKHCPYAEVPATSGYTDDIIGQVLGFAPKVLCSFASASRPSKQCPHMFCGESPLAVGMIQASLCRVCADFSHILGPDCTAAYC